VFHLRMSGLLVQPAGAGRPTRPIDFDLERSRLCIYFNHPPQVRRAWLVADPQACWRASGGAAPKGFYPRLLYSELQAHRRQQEASAARPDFLSWVG
jgi:hypothetical protein